MTNPVSLPGLDGAAASISPRPSGQADPAEITELGQRFEQMLWAEMLSHAGLEEAFTKSGGEAASAFSRFMVEAIARDMAEQQPLGFAEAIAAKAEASASGEAGETS